MDYNKRWHHAMLKVGADKAGAYIQAQIQKNIEGILPSLPEYGIFEMRGFSIKEESEAGSLRSLTMPSSEEFLEFKSLLSANGFLEVMYGIDPSGAKVRLSDEGRKLKELGSFKAYYDSVDAIEARAKKNDELQDIVLENHANIITWERKYKKAIQIVTILISVSAFALSVKSYYDNRTKDSQQLRMQERIEKLEERLHQLEETKNTPLKTDAGLDSVSLKSNLTDTATGLR